MPEFRAPGPVANAFLASDAPMNIIQGPIESGKSSTSAMRLYRLMCQMPRDKSGKRRSRMLVTRTTYPDLRGATIETVLDWFKPEIYCKPGGGKFYDTEPYLMEFRFRDVVSDWVFESFPDDKVETIRALRSKEFTAVWVNECQFTPQTLFFELASRSGRYPKKADLPEGYVRRTQIMGDMNAPPTDDHWILRMRGDVALPLDMGEEERTKYAKPPGMQFFMQPSALIEEIAPGGKRVTGYRVNPKAENLAHMQDGVRSTSEMERRIEAGEIVVPHRYIELTGGRSRAEIDRDLMGRVVKIVRGEPVFPQARRELHVLPHDVEPVPGKEAVVGVDFGLTPAAIFYQQINGRWVALYEIVKQNMGATEFAPLIANLLAQHFPDSAYSMWGDPAGGWKSQNDKRTPFQIFAANDLVIRAPAEKDAPEKRIEAMRTCLITLVDGQPRLMISPRCKHFADAVCGGYVMRRQSTADGTRLIEEPVKNHHSHPCEAGQYALWGAGEVRSILRPASGQRRTITSAVPKKRKLFAFTQKGRGRR